MQLLWHRIGSARSKRYGPQFANTARHVSRHARTLTRWSVRFCTIHGIQTTVRSGRPITKYMAKGRIKRIQDRVGDFFLRSLVAASSWRLRWAVNRTLVVPCPEFEVDHSKARMSRRPARFWLNPHVALQLMQRWGFFRQARRCRVFSGALFPYPHRCAQFRASINFGS
jgi:hypothetical protein